MQAHLKKNNVAANLSFTYFLKSYARKKNEEIKSILCAK